MLRRSIETYNQLQLNAAKLTNGQPVSAQLKALPETISEWVRFELPEEYV